MLCKNATYLAMTGDFQQTENLAQHLSVFTPHLVIEFTRSLLAECSEKKKRAENLIPITGHVPPPQVLIQTIKRKMTIFFDER